ncbi:hypothetical protein NE237_029601 [Protea cynaroides]|uniref:Legumain prodomain domain-containing protein n=1 Tax=Protea cynaroides TaxID=273540 RepID=A0A9Q0GSH2_9MAGN|nr:hypothetical protein NE237_029601 [Protea cynaroides]
MIRLVAGVILFNLFLVTIQSVYGRNLVSNSFKLPSEVTEFMDGISEDDDDVGTRWAVLIAGSKDYMNYRHQADVCHAYQILRKGGLKDENIIVFMYDDIASHVNNPKPGVIINNPHGDDVYEGVPKDYTGNDVTINNFFAVLLGNKAAVTGGSGKVVESGPNDHIFVYYSDHGGPGVLGMPTGPNIFANDLIDVLKKKHASGTYKSLVFYLESCESGSIFEGLLPDGLNIYATTAANAVENSYANYCPGGNPPPPPEYDTCLGDSYSVAWIEDSEIHDLRKESLKEQYLQVKNKTELSHVQQYGDLGLAEEHLFLYMGTNPEIDYSSFTEESSSPSFSTPVNQRDADLLHLWHKFRKTSDGSPRKLAAQKQFMDAVSHRMHIDQSIELIGKLLFGIEKGPKVLNAVRPGGQPLVDDWDCLKTMVRTFETHCGSLSQYGMKHMRSLANICNAGIKQKQMAEASAQNCVKIPSNPWSSLQNGFSA